MAVIPSAYNALMGMFSTRQPQNVSGSIYDMARADAQKQMLAQIGGGLMAAAVPQTATMRAQALQAALGNMGNIGTNVYNAAQARLMAQRTEQEQRQMAARDKFFSQGTQTIPGQRGVSVAGEVKPINMPDSVVAPGGIPVDRWGQITQIAQFDPDTATSMFKDALKAGSESSAPGLGSKTPLWVEYKGKTIPTYFLENGQLRGPGGEILDTKDPSFKPLDRATQAYLTSEQTVLGKGQGEATLSAPAVINSGMNTLNVIDMLLENENDLRAVVGADIGQIDNPSALKRIAGDRANTMVAYIEQLKAKQFIEAINNTDIKGALSDAEGLKLNAAESALKRTMNPDDFIYELKRYRRIVQTSVERQKLIRDNGYTVAQAQEAIPLDLSDIKKTSAESSGQSATGGEEDIDSLLNMYGN